MAIRNFRPWSQHGQNSWLLEYLKDVLKTLVFWRCKHPNVHRQYSTIGGVRYTEDECMRCGSVRYNNASKWHRAWC